VASGQSTSLQVSLNTAQVGNDTGVQLPLQLASSGAGTSGLGITTLTGETITLNGKVYATAVPALFIGNTHFVAHVGQTSSNQILIADVATGALTLGMNTATDGSFTGTAKFALASHDADQSDIAVAFTPLALTGTVYAYAKPILSTPPEGRCSPIMPSAMR
jgi:hypothetical protein